MTSITLIDRSEQAHSVEVDAEESVNLMELLRDKGFDVDGTCGGDASCGSCHVYLEQGQLADDVNAEERLTLEGMIQGKQNSRLACQIDCTRLSDVKLRLAPPEY